MLYFLIAFVTVVLDQALKFWVLENIPLYTYVDFIPGIMNLTYIQNTGAAFSFLSGQTGFLSIISLVMSIFLAYLLHIKYFSHPFGRLSLAFVLGGAVGNLIDRVYHGFVVDMFHLLFVRFAIFNIADIFVVVGGIGCAIYFIWFYDKIDGEDSDTSDETSDDEPDEEAETSESSDETSDKESPSLAEIEENEETT